MQDQSTPEMMNQAGAATFLNVPPRTLERWRLEGVGPQWIKLGHGKRGAVRYHRRALLEYIRQRTRESSAGSKG
ncbi:MAG TPA: helix-turn-helix domain-containing protein [Candidatus Angelobacter sp.]|nr:helix-turn-helix domain-containing protein [Candidatus Angelobacter sp.]